MKTKGAVFLSLSSRFTSMKTGENVEPRNSTPEPIPKIFFVDDVRLRIILKLNGALTSLLWEPTRRPPSRAKPGPEVFLDSNRGVSLTNFSTSTSMTDIMRKPSIFSLFSEAALSFYYSMKRD